MIIQARGQSEFMTTSYIAVPIPDLSIITDVAHKVAEIKCIIGGECKICFLVVDGEMHRQELTETEIWENGRCNKGLGFSIMMDELPDAEHHFMVYGSKGQYAKDRILKVEVL